MIDFKINREVIEILKQEGFYPDTLLTQYFILTSLFKGDTLTLNLLDDSFSSKRFILQYYELVRKELLKESADRSEFILTDKGRLFVEKLSEFLEDKKTEEFDNWFERWYNLFPKGIKSGGKLLRSDKAGCAKKMEKFIKDHNFSPSLILRATEDYLNERAAENYKFCKTATYLIDKRGEGSELAALCENFDDKKEIFTINTGLV